MLCVLTDVGTWTNLLTFEPDPDYSPDAEPDCFLRYRISAATRNFTSENRTGGPPLQRGVVLKWFY